jgi:hypothetical protein
MSEYGASEYSLDNYGTANPVESLTWAFLVFWDDEFVDESPIMINLQTDRGRDHLLSAGGAWERFRAGSALGTFDNTDGRFDAYNSSGPLYGFLLPGRIVRITVEVLPPYGDTPTTYDVIRGIIDDIQTGGSGEDRLATISIKDGLKWLEERAVALALVEDEEALITAAAIAEQVGFDEVDDWSIVQLGTDSVIVPYAFGNEKSALALINQLVDTEAGQIFHAKGGALTLATNDYTEAETTDIEQDKVLRDFELKQPWEVVRTRAQITANPMVEGDPAVLWTFGNDNSGASYKSSNILVYWTDDSDPPNGTAVDAIFSTGGVSTSPTVDFYNLRTAGFLPPGADSPSHLDLTTEDIGNGLRLTFTKQTGEQEWFYFITWIEVTATPIEAGDSVVITASDLAAGVIYGEKTFTLNTPWLQDANYAQQYAAWVVSQLKDAHLFPTIIIENRGMLQYSPELYTTKIHLTIDALGIDDTFRVGKISHRWLNSNGFSVQTTLKLEPVLDAFVFTPPPEV